jgi:serine/threonine protein kinase/WD40 repeat protein/tetratricopeptide (TPR) repeat protein
MKDSTPPGLPAVPQQAPPEESAQPLVALLLVDQRRRWQEGERVLVEAYVQQHPALQSNIDALLDLIYNEVILREEKGETPRLAGYQDRFPQLATQLEFQFALDRVLQSNRLRQSISRAGDQPAREAGSPPTATTADLAAADLPTVPGYEILKELGRGGMGVVYWAWQPGLNRVVALKMVLAGAHAGSQELARFRTEAEAVARLQHPHIVQVYEVGRLDNCPYMALEYVDGGSLAQKLAGTPLPANQAAQLLETLGRAIHYAHQRGIVHRDLTPANVLLTADGVPKITDFGLAKILGEGVHTQSGAILGTPSYMAPEQARGQTRKAGPAADVYALGAILYEMLVGRPPFRAETRLETILQVQSVEPVPPSRLQPKLPRDLETICLKCLEKDPQCRYGSAAELAEDLERFLDGRPIQAHSVSLRELAWRWCRRNPVIAGLSTSVAALSLVLAIGLVIGVLLREERNQARADRERAERSEKRAQAAEREAKIRSHLARAAAYRRSGQMGQRFDSLAELEKALQLDPSAELRHELRNELIACTALTDVQVDRELNWPNGSELADFDGNLERYARADEHGNVSIRRVVDDAELANLPGIGSGSDLRFLFSPDGRFLALYKFNGPVRLWDLSDMKPRRVGLCSQLAGNGNLVELGRRLSLLARHFQAVGSKAPRVVKEDQNGVSAFAIAFSPDSQQLAIGHANGSISVHDTTSGRETRYLKYGHRPFGLAFRPKHRQLAVSDDRTPSVAIYDLDTEKAVDKITLSDAIAALAWHPEGQILAMSCGENQFYLWDMARRESRLLEDYRGQRPWFSFNHAGDLLVSNDWTNRLQLWDTATGRELFSMPAVTPALRFGPDGRLAAELKDGKLQLLRVAPSRTFRTLTRSSSANKISYGEIITDGRWLAEHVPGGFALWDLTSGNELAFLPIDMKPIRFDTDGSLWTNAWERGLLRWPIHQGNTSPDLFQVGPPDCTISGRSPVSTSSNGQVLVIPLGEQGDAVVVHRGRPEKRVPLRHPGDVRFAAVSPDGRWVATGCHWRAKDMVKVWDAQSGHPLATLPLQGSSRVGFSPDNRWLVTSTTGEGCRLWAVESWQEGPSIRGEGFAFSADGKVLAVADGYGAARLVDPNSDKEYARLEAPIRSRLVPRCFTPDGTQLVVSGTESKLIHIWDLRSIGQHLVQMKLNWDLPPYSGTPALATNKPIQVKVDMGFLDSPRPRSSKNISQLHAKRILWSLQAELTPYHPEPYHQRGHVHEELGDYHKSIDDFTAALQWQPANAMRQIHLYQVRAENYLRLKLHAKAMADLQKILELDTTNARACNTLAWFYVTGPDELRDPNKAILLAKKAVELKPAEWMYLNTLGVVYYRLGQYPQAVITLERSLRESKGQFGACDLFFLAMSHARLGDAAHAKDCYDRAVKWVQERQGKLPPQWAAELTAFRAEAEALLKKDAQP